MIEKGKNEEFYPVFLQPEEGQHTDEIVDHEERQQTACTPGMVFNGFTTEDFSPVVV